ncbi:STAS domain-containing protein [Streptomyces sp. TRM70308]|uniref:STAS domain-containing protein n=1 Tax=Streptomyces sp. TRM70308 TaxID=3131932 RepID=UPI003CFE24C4
MDEHLTIRLHHTQGAVVVALSGEVDIDTAPDLRRSAHQLVDEGHQDLVIDMGDVTFCDSTGLSALIGIWHTTREAAGTMSLVAIPDRLHRMITVTGISELLPTYPTTAAALTAHPPPGAGPATGR